MQTNRYQSADQSGKIGQQNPRKACEAVGVGSSVANSGGGEQQDGTYGEGNAGTHGGMLEKKGGGGFLSVA